MNRAGWMGLIFGLALIAGLAWWLYGGDGSDDASMPPTAVDYSDPDAAAAQADSGETEAPSYPLHPATGDVDEAAEPLPELAASDGRVRRDTTALDGAAPLEGLLLPERLIERFVVTFNSLDGEMAPLRVWPVEHAEGVPAVQRGAEDRFRWQPVNAARYDAYVRAFTAPDASALVGLYIRYYPLLQEAFAALGEQEDYFNDRVITIIEHLLATPPAQSSYALRQPRVLFTFADPDLEALSAGQKLLLRIGPEHSRAVREQLRAIRAELIARTGAATDAATDADDDLDDDAGDTGMSVNSPDEASQQRPHEQ